jgi:hypothetical protein
MHGEKTCNYDPADQQDRPAGAIRRLRLKLGSRAPMLSHAPPATVRRPDPRLHPPLQVKRKSEVRPRACNNETPSAMFPSSESAENQ